MKDDFGRVLSTVDGAAAFPFVFAPAGVCGREGAGVLGFEKGVFEVVAAVELLGADGAGRDIVGGFTSDVRPAGVAVALASFGFLFTSLSTADGSADISRDEVGALPFPAVENVAVPGFLVAPVPGVATVFGAVTLDGVCVPAPNPGRAGAPNLADGVPSTPGFENAALAAATLLPPGVVGTILVEPAGGFILPALGFARRRRAAAGPTAAAVFVSSRGVCPVFVVGLLLVAAGAFPFPVPVLPPKLMTVPSSFPPLGTLVGVPPYTSAIFPLVLPSRDAGTFGGFNMNASVLGSLLVLVGDELKGFSKEVGGERSKG